jgi:Spy/CpxP family protein refolding chaperone
MRMMRTKTLNLAALALAVVTVAAALPLLAQGRGRGGGGGGPAAEEGSGRPLLAKLALYLDLDDAQKAQARQIFEDARAQAEPIRQANHDLAAQLRDALAADPPDPDAVGNLTIEIHANRETLRGIREAGQTSFRAILTEEQRLRLDALRDARRIFGRHNRNADGAGPDGGGGGEPSDGP